MKRRFSFIAFAMMLLVLLLAACVGGDAAETGEEKKGEIAIGYVSITAKEAKQLMDTEENYIIIDARTQEEYDVAHIPGAIMIPEYEIADRAEAELPDKEQLILVYCRSGRRSKIASQALADLGYTNVKEFGGIIDWPYETE
ncbi:MAG: rhodanese-like domain-containing protein [Ruminococcaceae bacterium]|nr:rhodanese-like domain-containing protein [Oscillospiraceae bacterium]